MTIQDVAALVSGLGSFAVAFIALWRSFRNDGRHWIEKLFQTAAEGVDAARAEHKSYAAQMESKLDHYVNRREFERHESDQREVVGALRNDFAKVSDKIDELKDIMMGRHTRP